MAMPYGGTYEFQGSAGDYFATPWLPGATCINCEGGALTCAGSFTLRLYATAGNFRGSVDLLPQSTPTAGVSVRAAGPGGVYQTTTDSQGAYNFTAGAPPQVQANNWGVGVTGDGSGPGFGTYELIAAGDPQTQTFATTQSSKATTVNFSLWSGFEQPTLCEPPSSNSGPGGREASTVSSTTPTPELPICPSCAVGRPVSVTTGAVHFDQTDATLPGVGPGLRFVRSYNSQLRGPGQYGMFGPGWNHLYEQRLTDFQPTRLIMLRRADGSPAYFEDNNGDSIYEPSAPFNKASAIVKQAGPTYVRQFRGGGSETYDNLGRLTSLTDPSSNTTSLTWNESGQLATITEEGGRPLNLAYVGGRIDTLSGPSGLIATYGYDAGRLASVTYADDSGSGYMFTYDNGTNQLLTVGDLTGRTLETHTYYGDGRAKTSEISGGQERLTLTYNNLKTTVTDPLSHQTTYDFRMIWGGLYVTKITGPCASCGGGSETQEWTYDNRGRVLELTRFRRQSRYAAAPAACCRS